MYSYRSLCGYGITELAEVGGGWYKGTVLYIDMPMLASLTKQQDLARNFLIENGFIQLGRYKKNPNSGNMIALFMKKPTRQRKQTKREISSLPTTSGFHGTYIS